MEILHDPWIGGAAIALLRVTDVSLDTLRIMLIARGHKRIAPVAGFFEALIFIGVVATVLRSDLGVGHMVGYAAGFALGNVVGIALVERLACGRMLVKVFSPRHGDRIAEALRAAGHRVTVLQGLGLKGPVPVLLSVVEESRLKDFTAVIRGIDSEAYLVGEVVTFANGGARPLKRQGWIRSLPRLQRG